jgi:hypothetical protein
MTKVAAIVTAVQAVLAALVWLGILELSADQLAALVAAVNAALTAAVSVFDPQIPWYGRTDAGSGD